MTRYDAAAYGHTHATVYDRLYGDRFDPTPAVSALSAAARGERVGDRSDLERNPAVALHSRDG